MASQSNIVKQKFRHVRLQYSELKSWPDAYLVDSSETYCRFCHNTIMAKHCKVKRYAGSKKDSFKAKNFLRALKIK